MRIKRVVFVVIVIAISLSWFGWKTFLREKQTATKPPTGPGTETSPSSTPIPTPIPICEIITASELEMALGEAVSPTQNDAETCFWTATSGGYTPTVSITRNVFLDQNVDATPESSGATVESALQQVWRTQREHDQALPSYVVIDGLGEAAYQTATGVSVLQGSQLLKISVSATNPSSNRTLAVTIAQKITQRLR